ncbi:DUF2500 domain-containing protein [Paenibacillus thailandensis]|uniref:DUF2500 domain-containing protein n=1 Tax=Paenibacillus thailandensis TaxID=393250 RepID=A0ABW5QXG3_9BACL
MGMNGFGPSFGPPPIFTFFFFLIAAVIAGTFLFIVVRGLRTWSSNNAAEPETRSCKVAAKRTEVWGGSGDSSANTSYFITFEFHDGSRKELPVRGADYGMIAEGDYGIVTFQGTRFKHFDRGIPQ